MAYTDRRNLYFGTEEVMEWFPTPLRGATANPEGWQVSGSLLSGGGYSSASWGSHKNYRFEWGSATPSKYAQRMKSFADGTFGRGLIYFHNPLDYEKNLLPARWADPSMALNSEGGSLVYGLNPTRVTTTNRAVHDLPVAGASYDMLNIAPGFRGKGDALFIPIPPGYTLGLGALYTHTGSGRVFVNTVQMNGDLGPTVPLNALANNGTAVIGNTFAGTEVRGVWLWVGKTTTGIAGVVLYGMVARLMKDSMFSYAGPGYGLEPYGQTPYGGQTVSNANPKGWLNGPWIGGMGHSGVRFEGKPTFDITGPFDGGQAGFAAGFREVGSWNYG